MATRKRSRSETEESADDDDSPTTSASNSDLAVANKRARKSAPIDKILNVAELCEQVLSYLPMYDLLRAMQVCRAFKTNIESSYQLQKTLFLAPDLPRSKLAISSSGTLLSGIRATQQVAAAKAAGEDETGEVVVHTPHPAVQLYARTGKFMRLGLVEYAKSHVEKKVAGEEDIRAYYAISPEFCYTRTGLDNMFLTQPPTKAVKVSNEAPGNALQEENIFVETGVKFKDLIKTMRVVARQNDHMAHTISLKEGRLACARARELAENAGELSLEDDPTRWIARGFWDELKEDGFDFLRGGRQSW
jgi:hypothetical protein